MRKLLFICLFFYSIATLESSIAFVRDFKVHALEDFILRGVKKIGDCEISLEKKENSSSSEYQIVVNKPGQSCQHFSFKDGETNVLGHSSGYFSLPENRSENVNHFIFSTDGKQEQYRAFSTKSYAMIFYDYEQEKPIGAVFERDVKGHFYSLGYSSRPAIFCGDTGNYWNHESPVIYVSLKSRLSGNFKVENIKEHLNAQVESCKIMATKLDKNKGLLIRLVQDGRSFEIVAQPHESRKYGDYAGGYIHNKALAFPERDKNVAAIQVWDAQKEGTWNSITHFQKLIIYYDYDTKKVIGVSAKSSDYQERKSFNQKTFACGDIGLED